MTRFRVVYRNGRRYVIPIHDRESSGKFIQHSIKRPGRVREYLKRTYGNEAFTERGTIKVEYLDKAKERAEKSNNRSLVDAIDLAKRLKKMNNR